MNVTQLQIILNQVYEFRNTLNETLVKSLLERDELLSKRDSMLACIEVNRGQWPKSLWKFNTKAKTLYKVIFFYFE